ncbi:MAG TPA: hypothetical protein VN377_05095 [Candidatus Thermoplasmatota archaeon]|nr:hypothetical protein [Candidatus Thermoplasmatota archaeon]
MNQCFGAVLASMVLATYPVSLVGAQMTSAMKDQIHQDEIILLTVKELADQGMDLNQLHSELQTMHGSMQSDNQKRGQGSLSLRGFCGNSLFSCRGFA